MTSFSELKQRLFLPHYVINFYFCLPYFIIRYLMDWKHVTISFSLGSVLFAIFPQPSYQGPTEIVELSGDNMNNIRSNNLRIIDQETKQKLLKGKAKEVSGSGGDIHWIVLF